MHRARGYRLDVAKDFLVILGFMEERSEDGVRRERNA